MDVGELRVGQPGKGGHIHETVMDQLGEYPG
jgi:hypothetical protein